MSGHISPPISEDRRAELIPNPPDYGTKRDAKLKDEMRRRGLELRGRRKRAHYVKALQDSDERDFDAYKRWEARHNLDYELKDGWALPKGPDLGELNRKDIILRTLLARRQDDMFASKHEPDPSRVTFLDLPAEVQNMIYDFALFRP